MFVGSSTTVVMRKATGGHKVDTVVIQWLKMCECVGGNVVYGGKLWPALWNQIENVSFFSVYVSNSNPYHVGIGELNPRRL